MKNIAVYPTSPTESETGEKEFFFESRGRFNVVKTVVYSLVEVRNGRQVYNLAFGDYDPQTGYVSDVVNSNNGDMYKVFHTVLSTVPLFFADSPGSVLLVQGSDTDADVNQCRLACRKNCPPGSCKNVGRRIVAYRRFVDSHFVDLSQDYVFFGQLNDFGPIVQYLPGTAYRALLVYQKQ